MRTDYSRESLDVAKNLYNFQMLLYKLLGHSLR